MKRLTLIAAALALAAGARVASADDDSRTYAFRHVPAPLPAEPAPVVRIVQPAPEQVNATHATRKPHGESYESLECLTEDKDRVIQLAAEHWPVKPGGPGVLVVVDGKFATVTHDLSKPIRIDQLEPFHEWRTDSTEDSPVAGCGWHSIAVVPTAANGQMLDVPVTVGWYLNQSDNPHWTLSRDLDYEKKQPLIVVNWPLIGAFVPGASMNDNDEPTGWVAATPDKLMIDTAIAQRPDCHVKLMFDEHHEDGDHGVPGRGAEVLSFKPSYGKELLEYNYQCADGGGSSWEGMRIYTKPPKANKLAAWPGMSSELSAKNQAAARRAHRIPGVRPYDGTFYAQSGGGTGSLTCPSPVTIKNASTTIPVVLGGTLSFGTAKVTVDVDGFIQPQTFHFGKPKLLKGQKSSSELDAEAGAIAGVVISGEFQQETILHSRGPADAPSTSMELKIEAIDAAGNTIGRDCHASMRKEGHFIQAATCSHDHSTCGSGGGYLPCC